MTIGGFLLVVQPSNDQLYLADAMLRPFLPLGSYRPDAEADRLQLASQPRNREAAPWQAPGITAIFPPRARPEPCPPSWFGAAFC